MSSSAGRFASPEAVRGPRPLTLGLRLRALRRLLGGNPLADMVDILSDPGLVELQRFLWNRAVEVAVKVSGEPFDRRRITRHMEPTRQYMLRKGCEESLFRCKAVQCVELQPACARQKLKGQLNAISKAVAELLAGVNPGPAVFLSRRSP